MVGLGLCGCKVIEDPVRIQQRWGSQIKSEAVAFLGRTDVSDKGLKAKLIEAAKFRKRGSRRNQQQDENSVEANWRRNSRCSLRFHPAIKRI